MNYLAENSLPIWTLGAVALTMALVVYLQTRSNRALGAMAAIVVIVAALLALESWIETPREAVERTLYELAAAVESNDVSAAMSYLAPMADDQIRNDVETLMPLVKIERARVVGTPKTDVGSGSEPVTAITQFRGLIIATNLQRGMKGAADDNVTLYWIRNGDRWLVRSYTSERQWHRALGR
jgi:uncharacterized membrane protein